MFHRRTKFSVQGLSRAGAIFREDQFESVAKVDRDHGAARIKFDVPDVVDADEAVGALVYVFERFQSSVPERTRLEAASEAIRLGG